jgi:hypothetical protein
MTSYVELPPLELIDSASYISHPVIAAGITAANTRAKKLTIAGVFTGDVQIVGSLSLIHDCYQLVISDRADIRLGHQIHRNSTRSY